MEPRDLGEKILDCCMAAAFGILIILILWIMSGCTPFDPYASLATPAADTQTATLSAGATVTPSILATVTPLPVYIVAAGVLEIRTAPSEAAQNIGYLRRGDRVTVYQTAQAEQEYCPSWAKIDPAASRWVCFKNLTGE